MNPYKAFPNANLIKEWDKLLKLSREDVVDLSKAWEKINKENKELSEELYKKKTTKLKEVEDFMKLNNIEIWKHGKQGMFTERRGYQSWFKNNIADKITEKYPHYSGHIPVAHMDSFEVDGFMLRNNQSPTTIVELYDKMKREYNSRLSEASLKDKLLVESIKYANANSINLDGLMAKDVIGVVDDYARGEYRKQNLPNGTEIYLKHGCDECSTFFVGEHRCSCGNRRIAMVVEGNLIEGYDYYPEAY